MIPAPITKQLAALNDAFETASPVEGAPRAVRTGLANRAADFLISLDAAIIAQDLSLTTPADHAFAEQFASALVGASTATDTQLALTDLRGLAGRVADNLRQA